MLQVLAPYDAEDARGLLKAAIRDPDPVVFLENEILYGESFPVTDQVMDKDFVQPIGKAKVRSDTPSLIALAPHSLCAHAQHLQLMLHWYNLAIAYELTCHMQVMREGTDVTLLAFGKLVGYNLKVAEELEKEGISCEVQPASLVFVAIWLPATCVL